jgi:hypothetical protein
LARVAQQLGYGRLNMFGADLVEGDSEGQAQQRIVGRRI